MEKLLPVDSVELAVRTGCQGIGWTYNDPTIWIEQTYEAMVAAKERGLYSVYMTNGYATQEHLDMVGPYLSSWRLDLKGFSRKMDKFTKIGEGDLDWADVRRALYEIAYYGWAAAEVGGGNADRLREVSKNMDRVFGLKKSA